MLHRFGIPFGLATSLGLAVRALDLPLTITEAGNGMRSIIDMQHKVLTSYPSTDNVLLHTEQSHPGFYVAFHCSSLSNVAF